jgi:hypothetical protein
VTGRARFGGIDVRWMREGVELRGEYLLGKSLDYARTDGAYVDVIAHKPWMGPMTVLGRAEWIDYDTIPHVAEWELHTRRFQAGARVRVWQGLSVAAGVSHQAGQITQYRPTALDFSLTYAVRAIP